MPNRNDRMSMLMQLLPVILAQQQHQAETNQIGQFHQGELGNQQAQLAELARYHQGEMEHQQALEALGIRQADSTDRQNQLLTEQHAAILAQQSKAESDRQGEYWGGQMPFEYYQQAQKQKLEQDNANRALKIEALHGATVLPGMTPEKFYTLSQALNVPGMDTFNKQTADTLAQGQADRLRGILGPIYSGFKDKPVQTQSTLNQLWQSEPGMMSEGVQKYLRPFINQQDASLAQPQNGPQAAQDNVGWIGKLGWGAVDLIPDLWNAAVVPGANRMTRMLMGTNMPQIPQVQLPAAQMLPNGYGADAYKQYRGTYQQ